MTIIPKFEDNAVGRLKKEIWEASDKEIDEILREFEVPSPGEMEKPNCYFQNTLPEIQQEKIEKNDVVLIPLGSTEYHGLHSVAGQDTYQVNRLCEAVRRYTAKQGREVSVAFCPWMYGDHPFHHLGMIGTVPISQSAVVHLLVDVMFGLWAQGLRKFIFVNNHGQQWSITQAIDEFGKKYPELPYFAVAYEWCGSMWEFYQVGVCFDTDFIHSDECEASLVLLLAPEMVDMSKAVDTKPRGYLPDGHVNKSSNQNIHRPNFWYNIRNNVPLEVHATPEGVIGSATKGSAEKAKKPVAGALKYMNLLIDDILKVFPPGVLPPIEEVTLFKKEEVEGYQKKLGEPGYKNPYRLWRPYY